MKEIKKTHNFGFSVNSICQVAISEYLDIVSINKISSFYQEKEITFDSFWQIVGLNYSRVKGLIFKLPLTKLFQRD
jgi:methionine aminotransferase